MLEVKGLYKELSQFKIKDVSFRVNRGDYFMLLGPSGAGKSIILEVIAGLVEPDCGQIIVNGIDVTKIGIGKRGVGLVFQDLAIFPNMTVSENIGYSLRRKGTKRNEELFCVHQIANKLSISHLLDRNPTSLSGGELQRVALARTLILHPAVLLLDEPLSSIDVQLRSELKALLRGLNREGQTIVHVTHDYDEAISLGNNVAIVSNGMIVQNGSPIEVFQNPASEFVANFSGIKNFFQGSICEKTKHDLSCFQSGNCKFWFYTDMTNGEGFISFPETAVTISIEQPDNSAINFFHGVVDDIFQQKHGYEVWVNAGVRIAAQVTWESVERLNLSLGKEVWISVKANTIGYIPKVN